MRSSPSETASVIQEIKAGQASISIQGYRIAGGRCWLKVQAGAPAKVGWIKQGAAGKDTSRSNAYLNDTRTSEGGTIRYVVRWDGIGDTGTAQARGIAKGDLISEGCSSGTSNLTMIDDHTAHGQC